MGNHLRIPESELILNSDGTVYHLNIRPENLAETILIVGDPKRVDMISGHFDSMEFRGHNREIVTHTGSYRGKRLTVMSTGMGTDNMDIVINELDALVNIDLEKREVKKQKTSLNIIRIGTSGALQPDIPLNSMILSRYGLGLDGLIRFYQPLTGMVDEPAIDNFIRHCNWPSAWARPYLVEASSRLIDLFSGRHFLEGITATAPGFYGPQGRHVRLPLAYPNLTQQLMDFRCREYKILNFEMETSALFGLSKMLGHHAITCCISVANRSSNQYSKNYLPAMSKLIEEVLDIIGEL